MEDINIIEESKNAKLTEAQKKLAKHIAKKFAIGLGVALAVHFASAAIVKALNNEEDEATEDETVEAN